jgi:Tol biopolymer transport system component
MNRTTTSDTRSATTRGAPLLLALAAALLTCLTACADDPAEGATRPGPSSSAGNGEAAGPGGRLMYSRFDESTRTFGGTFTAAPDGSDETAIQLPGPEGGGRWSHSGGQIAVMTILDDERVGTAVIAPDGTVDQVLDIPDPTLNLVCTVWSPDDARLACEGWDDTDASRRGIYSVRATDGGDLHRITTTPRGLVDLPGDYAPDGGSFVFLRAREESLGRLRVVDPAGGRSLPVARGRYEDPARFSPDGSSLLTSDGHALVVLGTDGHVTGRISVPGANLFGAVWSPDGGWIAFSAGSDGPVADVFVSRPDGSDRRQVTDTPDNEIRVEWGASGS